MKRSICLALLSLCVLAQAEKSTMVPVGHYLASAKKGIVVLPSTKLNRYYFPANIDSISVTGTWSKNTTVSKSYPKTGGSGGSGLSVFGLTITNNSDHNIYAYLRGLNNQSWEMACTIPASSTGANYEAICVSSSEVQAPIGFPYQFYLSRNTFSSQTSFETSSTPYACTIMTGQASVTKNVVMFEQPIAYSASINNEHCVVSTS